MKNVKGNKVTAADERALYFALMGEENCCELSECGSIEEQLDNCNEALWIYQDMLLRAIRTDDQDDIRSLRRRIQEIKIEKRRLLAS